MKRFTFLATIAVAMTAVAAFAGEPSKCATKTGKAKCSKSAELVSGKGGCCGKAGTSAVAKAMGKLPQMLFVAGDTKTPCYETASKTAGCPSKVKFEVAGKTFDSRPEASGALATLLEKQADDMLVVRYVVGEDCIGCSKTAQKIAKTKGVKMTYRLAGLDFESQEKANAAADAVRKAIARLASDSNTGVSEDGKAKSPCSKACSKTASTVAGKDSPCAKKCGSAAKTQTASADAKKSGCCSKAKTASAVASKDAPCSKKCGSAAKAQTASADAKKSGCCSKAKTVAADAKKSDCCKGKAKEDCCKGAAQTASAEACAKQCPMERLTKVQEMIKVMVETATAVRTS